MITECLSIKCALQKYSNEAKDFELYEIYREYCFSSFRAGTIHKVRKSTQSGREVVKAKAYIYCFYNVVILLKSVEGERGYLKIIKFECTYFMDIAVVKFD